MTSPRGLKAIEESLWQIKTELHSIAFLVKAVEEGQGGKDLIGLGLILERHATLLEDLIERVTTDGA